MGEGHQLWLVRHGATEWSENGRHTSVTDLPLLPEGRSGAEALRPALTAHTFAKVLASPRLRAMQTAAAAGFSEPEVDEDLVEWDYGPGEGLTTQQIHQLVPGWLIWTNGAPTLERDGFSAGETVEAVGDRMDRVLARIKSIDGDSLVFGHGHALRALTARWLGFPVAAGSHFPLQTSTVCVLGWEHGVPGILRWNASG